MKKILLFCLVLFACTVNAQVSVIDYKDYRELYDPVLKTEIIGFYIQDGHHLKEVVGREKELSKFHTDSVQFIAATDQVLDFDKQYKAWNKAHPDDKMDRGHKVPFKAMACISHRAAWRSMNASNISPQNSYFNEHQWEQCESHVIDYYAKNFDTVKVWQGVLIGSKLVGTIHKPDYYFKYIQYDSAGIHKEKAWLGLNDKSNVDTNPDDMIITPSQLQALIKKYYPKLHNPFNF